MLLYYITDRTQFSGSEQERRAALLSRIAAAASAGVDYIQLREKDLSASELEKLARMAVRAVRENSAATRILINSRTDVAIAVGADGVHLTSTDIAASEARAIAAMHLRESGANRKFLVAASCHSVAEIRSAESHGADFAVLAPIFEKFGTQARPLGTALLAEAARTNISRDTRVEAGDHRVTMPIIALGGVTLENAAQCVRAGAAGIAAIRLFQQGDLPETVRRLRALS